MVVAARLTPDGPDMNTNAIFMVFIVRMAVKACVFMGRGERRAVLKAADLMHRQIVDVIVRTNFKGGNDA